MQTSYLEAPLAQFWTEFFSSLHIESPPPQRPDADGTSFTDRFSGMDLGAGDRDPDRFRRAHPLAAEARPLRAVLRPGDVLFVPKMWWHVVSSTPDPDRGINIMANMFFEPRTT